MLFGITLLKHGRHFDNLNQPPNMRMRDCYVECNKDGLCCYLVIHIENLLLPLQLFYFHSCPSYFLTVRFMTVVLRQQGTVKRQHDSATSSFNYPEYRKTYGKSVDFKWFWRYCITLGIIGFLNFVHRQYSK
jgi:hypothetical protein